MSFVRRYLTYLRPHGWRVFGGFLAGLAFVVFSGVSFWMAADFVQALFSGRTPVPPLPEGPVTLGTLADVLKHYSARLITTDTTMGTLQRAILFILGAFFLKNLSLYVQTLLAASVEQRIAKRMRDQLYERLMAQDLAFFHVRKTGDLVASGINDVTQLNEGLSESFSKLIRDPLNVIMFLVLLLSISWQMTLATLVIAPLSGLVISVAGVSLKRKARRTQEKVGAVTARLNETLYGMRIVQAYGGEEHEEREFHKTTESHFREALGRERLRRLVPPLEEMVGVFVIAAILLVAGGRVLGGQWLEPQEFVRFLVLLFGLLTPLVSLGEVQARLKVASGAAERVFALLDERHDIDEVENPAPVEGFRDRIRFEEVHLQYGQGREKALDGVTLEIAPRERVVLVGRSGSGKSSLLNLLPRFYDPTEGRILLDGVDLKELELDGLRGLFGIVTQDITLFHDTVAANIAYGEPDAPRERIVRAAKLAHAHHFIEDLPEGYDTDLGNLGERLSGGQRQRISIARALLGDPPILLLDEPTSALDADVAAEIERTLDEVGQGRTVVMATHRLSTIHAEDRVVFFDRGRVVAEGFHRDLMDRNPDYRELVTRQLKP